MRARMSSQKSSRIQLHLWRRIPSRTTPAVLLSFSVCNLFVSVSNLSCRLSFLLCLDNLLDLNVHLMFSVLRLPSLHSTLLLQRSVTVCCPPVVSVSHPSQASPQNQFQRRHSQTLSAITSFDPVSVSTPTAVVTEIDEDSAFTEAPDNLRVLLSQGKRRSVDMNASSSVGDEGDPRCAGTDVNGMRMADDIGDLDETQAQQPGSKRHKEGNAARDMLDQLRHDALVRDQRMAERDAAAAAALADKDAAKVTKLESLMKSLSASVDIEIKRLSDTLDGKMTTLEQRVQERKKTFEDKWGSLCAQDGTTHFRGLPSRAQRMGQLEKHSWDRHHN